MQPSQILAITAALDAVGLPIPKPVQQATALVDAVTAKHAALEAEPAPDPNTLIHASDADHIIEGMAEYSTLRPARLEAARRLVIVANDRVTAAWAAEHTGIVTKLAAAYDKAAADFVAALDKLGGTVDQGNALATNNATAYHQAIDAAHQLTMLARARDQFAYSAAPTNILPTKLDELTRIAAIPSLEHAVRIIPGRIGSMLRYSAEWWAGLASTPGVALKWHTAAEQAELVAHLPSAAQREHGAVVA